jgi:uncharacterized protein (UPF0276 family)
MEYFARRATDGPAVGLANGPIVRPFLESFPDVVVDYVEVPFEQLRHDPTAGSIQVDLPIVLHCSSMSIAGFVSPTDATLHQIEQHVVTTRTPWIGEHLAFISADELDGGDPVDDGAGGTIELTYTVCPQLSEETIDRVGLNLSRLRQRFDVPIILENSPQYFQIPGSTMAMTEFVAKVAEVADVDLLLDITHFLITAGNMGHDPISSVHQLPLERVREVHLSGMSHQEGRWWDDHAVPAPQEAFDLLAAISDRIRPDAVTFEYNWAPSIPGSVLVEQVQTVRTLLS